MKYREQHFVGRFHLRQKCALALFVREFLRCPYAFCAAENDGIRNNGGLPVVQCSRSSAFIDSLKGQSATIFVDANTWLRRHLHSADPYLLHFSFQTPSRKEEVSFADITVQTSHVFSKCSCVAFVLPLPFALPGAAFALVTPMFAFNVFGSSSVGQQQLVQAILEQIVPIALEGICVHLAPTLHVKLVRRSEGHAFGGKNADTDAALRNHFRESRLLCNGDHFSVEEEPTTMFKQRHIFQVHFPGMGNDERTAQFVQCGVSTCLAEEGPPPNEPFPGRIPQELIPANLLVPTAIRKLALRMAQLFWPIFHASQRLPSPLVLLHSPGEGATLACEQLATLLDVRLCSLQCLDLWEGEEKTVAKTIRQKFERVNALGPCVCRIQDAEVLFRNGTAKSSDGLRLLLNALATATNLRPTTNGSRPIVFILSIDASNPKSEIPERMARMLHWEFALEEGDDRLDRDERTQFARLSLRNGPLGTGQRDLAENIAENTKGYSPLEMAQLFADAEQIALVQHRSSDDRGPLPLLRMEEHFRLALQRRAPDKGAVGSRVGMDDVGGQAEAKQLLGEALAELVRERGRCLDGRGELAGRMMRKRTGILLHGPPGCGKTLLAKAVANEFGLAFVSVKGPELLSQFVGESERNLREVFARAKRSSPAVLFFDELDSLAPARGTHSDSGAVMGRLVSQLVAEMDACLWSRRKAVFVMGATNRPDLLDPCLLSPGRFEQLVPIQPATDLASKTQILRPLCKQVALERGFSVQDIALSCPQSMSGAELAGLVSSATMNCLRELIAKGESGGGEGEDNTSEQQQRVVLAPRHFEAALSEMKQGIR